MIYVLNIGCDSYAFANANGLQTVMTALAKARPLKHHYWPGCERDHEERLELSDRPVEVSMHCVQGVSFVSGKQSRREVIEPEVLPRERGESDAAFAMRVSGRKAARQIGDGSRRAVAAQLRLMLQEGNRE